jgi:hypothetical protein
MLSPPLLAAISSFGPAFPGVWGHNDRKLLAFFQLVKRWDCRTDQRLPMTSPDR